MMVKENTNNIKTQYSTACLARAEMFFGKKVCYQQYLDLETILIKQK